MIKMTKRCGRCRAVKDLAEFNKDRQTKSGLSNRCRACSSIEGKNRHKRNRQDTEKWKETLAYRREWRVRNLEKDMINRSRIRAVSLGIPHNIDESDIYIPDYCPVLGIPIVKTGGKDYRDNWPSLDRVDSTKGYEKGNVKVISWRANTLKKDGTLEEFLQLASWLQKELHS